MNTPTPRTDAVELPEGVWAGIVRADFARQLERELADAKFSGQLMGKERDELVELRSQLISERDQWRECARELVKSLGHWPLPVRTCSCPQCIALEKFNQLEGKEKK